MKAIVCTTLGGPELLQLQEELNHGWQGHVCQAAGPGHVLSPEDRSMAYFELCHKGPLNFPSWTCKCFSALSPVAVGFFPSSPTSPDVWYNMDVFIVYQRPALLEGLSATGVGFSSRPCKW